MFLCVCYVTIVYKHALNDWFSYQSILISEALFMGSVFIYISQIIKRKTLFSEMLSQRKSVIFSIQIVDYKWKNITWLFQFHLHKQHLCDPYYDTLLVLLMKNYQE